MRRLVCLLVVLGACSDDAVSVAPEANPLGTTANILPYPSSLYEAADGTLDVPIGAFPRNTVTKQDFDPTPLARRRGWSATTTILWAAAGGVDPASLVDPSEMATTVDGTSSTVIVDMTTGELVAHFSEVDANELDNFSIQAIYLRPAKRLAGEHRYAVGIRKSVTGLGGKALAVSPGFQAVLDDRDLGHARLDKARPRLRAAVAALEGAGVPRSDLLVAWDFTVAPDADAIVDPLAARDAVLGAIGTLGANVSYTVTSDLGPFTDDTRIARRIELAFMAPAVTGEAHAGFFRDGTGTVIAQGTMVAKAFIMVPPCATSSNKAGLLIYGHGFFGSLEELKNAKYARDLAKDGCFIVAGTQWVGMSNDDIANALIALNDLNKGWGFGERIWQGIANTITLEQILRGKLATELLVDSGSQSIVDTTREYFLGISLGHVLGSTFFAYDPFIDRAVLNVGAANWALMFERSSNWASYGLPLKGSYDTLMDADIMEQILQMALEPVDGGTVAGLSLPNTPTKHFLMQTSLDDTQVPNLASFFQARSLGATLLTQSVVVPFGFEAAQATSSDRAWLIIDEKPSPKPPATNEVFAYTNAAHENTRRRALLQQQMRDFWAQGVATNPCTGPTCDCAAGNCGPLGE
jgi:hypothetical protein